MNTRSLARDRDRLEALARPTPPRAGDGSSEALEPAPASSAAQLEADLDRLRRAQTDGVPYRLEIDPPDEFEDDRDPWVCSGCGQEEQVGRPTRLVVPSTGRHEVRVFRGGRVELETGSFEDPVLRFCRVCTRSLTVQGFDTQWTPGEIRDELGKVVGFATDIDPGPGE